MRKASKRPHPVPQLPKKKLHAVQVASHLPISSPAPHSPDPKSPEPNKPLCEAWEDSRYLNDLPGILLDYVKTTLNVDSDGHCGFRAAAHCL